MGLHDAEITELLLRWNAGDRSALEQLTPVVYDELRRMARGLLAKERPDHTLSATALVHEAYLKLIDQRKVNWEHRAHFFGAAGHIMRRVLIDYANGKMAAKRGGSSKKIALEIDVAGPDIFLEEMLSLDAVLEELAAFDLRKARIVEMKFFAGMTNPEVARALSISDATVERDWKMARAWLIQALAGRGPEMTDCS